MRLLYVIHQFFPDCHSGTEQYCLAAAQEARRRGDEVTVLSLNPCHGDSMPPVRVFDAPYDGFDVKRINHWQQINPNDVLRDYNNPHLEGWFRQVLEQVSPDAVHFFHLRQLGSNLIDTARRHGARTVVNLMDFWYLCPRFTLLRTDGELCEGPPDGGRGCVACEYTDLADVEPGDEVGADHAASRLKALLERKGVQLENLSLADTIVAPSKFLAEMFVKNGLPRERMTVVPYGLAPDRLQPIEAQRPRSPLRLGFCGVLSPWKSPHLAVRAVRDTAAQVTLTVHGRTDEPMFQDYIDDMLTLAGDDPRISFPGAYAGDRTAAVFAEMDVLVVPSTWYENTPFVVLEALTAGVPVIASDLGGLSEVVQHDVNGKLFRAGDADALRAAVEQVAADPSWWSALELRPPHGIAENYDVFAGAYRG